MWQCHAGGLLSTHIMLERRPAMMAAYDGCLLRLAVDLGDRLLPAFDTLSGIPLSWINLRKVSQCLLCQCLTARLLLGCSTVDQMKQYSSWPCPVMLAIWMTENKRCVCCFVSFCVQPEHCATVSVMLQVQMWWQCRECCPERLASPALHVLAPCSLSLAPYHA